MILSRLDRLKTSLAFRWMEKTMHPLTVSNHDAILRWANMLAEGEGHDSDIHGEASTSEIVRRGMTLRNRALSEFKDRVRHRHSNLRVLIHIPPSSLSPGGYSLFNNLLLGFRYIGIEARALEWSETLVDALQEFRPTVLISSDHPDYLKRLDPTEIERYRCENLLLFGLTASIPEDGNPDLEGRLVEARRRGVDFFYGFRSEEYLCKRPAYAPFFDAGFPVLSVEFGANPLLYFPVAGIERDLDYVFLASSNPDKWQRYVSYLPPIFRKNVGFLDGPGWKLSKEWAPPNAHRFLYARARVGINLHIEESVQWPSELNERTYILAACGVPQVVDAARLLPSRFNVDSFFVGCNPLEYREAFERALHDRDEANRRATAALEEVFAKHTSFHRAEKFAGAISELLDVPR